MFVWCYNPVTLLQAECQNFIRVIAKTDENRILICGTHAFKPRCRHYKYKVTIFTRTRYNSFIFFIKKVCIIEIRSLSLPVQNVLPTVCGLERWIVSHLQLQCGTWLSNSNSRLNRGTEKQIVLVLQKFIPIRLFLFFSSEVDFNKFKLLWIRLGKFC